MNTFDEPSTMVEPQPVVSPARVASLPPTVTFELPEVMALPAGHGRLSARIGCERRTCHDHQDRGEEAAVHRRTLSRSRSGGTGMPCSTRAAAFSSTSLTM